MNLLDEKINAFKKNEELIQSQTDANYDKQKLDLYEIAKISNQTIMADLKKNATFNLAAIIPLMRDIYSQLEGKEYQAIYLTCLEEETLYTPNILFSREKELYTRKIALIDGAIKQDSLTDEELWKLQEQGDLIVIFSQKLTADKLKYSFPKSFEYDVRQLFNADENNIFKEFMKELINHKLVLNSPKLSVSEMIKVKDEFILKYQGYALTKKIS